MTLARRVSPAQDGVSLIETAIALVVLALVVAMGTPSFLEWINNAQIRTAAESILAGLQVAKNEAVRRNANVQFVLGNPGVPGGTGWKIVLAGSGATVQAAPDGEGTSNTVVTTTPADATAVTFTGLGRTPPPPGNLNADGSPLLARVDIDSSVLAPAASRELRILVSAGGELRLCDPSVTVAGDPRNCEAAP